MKPVPAVGITNVNNKNKKKFKPGKNKWKWKKGDDRRYLKCGTNVT